MLRGICISVILGLFMAVTAQAKWIAKTETMRVRYDRYGNSTSSEVSKEALAAYEKASACLKYLRIRFNEGQKVRREQRLWVHNSTQTLLLVQGAVSYQASPSRMVSFILVQQPFIPVKRSRNNSSKHYKEIVLVENPIHVLVFLCVCAIPIIIGAVIGKVIEGVSKRNAEKRSLNRGNGRNSKTTYIERLKVEVRKRGVRSAGMLHSLTLYHPLSSYLHTRHFPTSRIPNS